MDMKKILQNFDSAASRPKAESSDMKKFLSIVSEAAKDLDTTKTESGLQYHIGKKKYGKEGMKKLAQAGQDGASEEELGRIKDKYKKEDFEMTIRDYFNLIEAHGNSKIYDKCWKGYKKVPGKKRGEKGSCEKK